MTLTHVNPALTPSERQEVLRRLKRGPSLPKKELARYAERVREEVLARRTAGTRQAEKDQR